MAIRLQHPILKAFMILAALGLGLFWWMKQARPYTPATFYYQYYRVFPIDSLEQALLDDSDLAVSEALIQEGIKAHHYGQYASLVESFEQALKDHPGHPLLHFYLGQAYLNLGKREAAIPCFRIARQGGGDWVNIAAWYEALTYLQGNNPAETLAILEKVSGRYEVRAKALANDLSP